MQADRILGAHISISGGLHTAFRRAEILGCNCMQLFTKNNMQWKDPPISEESRKLFISTHARSKIDPLVSHANYLINLASPDLKIWKRSLESFYEEIHRAYMLEIPYLVIHPGNHMGLGEKHGEALVARALNMALERFLVWEGKILLETTAGQGTSLGYTFQSLHRISEQVQQKKSIGFCLDTCHIFAAGYDIRSVSSFEKTMKEFDDILGISRLQVVHINDSKGSLGYRQDRHEHIGEGTLGLKAIKNFLKDSRLSHIPFIIETPKGKNKRKIDFDEINLKKLRELLKTHSQE